METVSIIMTLAILISLVINHKIVQNLPLHQHVSVVKVL